MKSAAAVETLVVAKEDERGRRIADPKEKEALLAGYAGSGMTLAAFAEREGINRFTLAGWVRKKRQVGSRGGPGVAARFVELGVARMATGFGLEVVLPDGLIVRGRDAKEVAALIRGLR